MNAGPRFPRRRVDRLFGYSVRKNGDTIGVLVDRLVCRTLAHDVPVFIRRAVAELVVAFDLFS